MPHTNGWQAKREGGERASKVTQTKQEALDFGRALSKKDHSELIIRGRNGQIQDKDSYGSDPMPPKDTKH